MHVYICHEVKLNGLKPPNRYLFTSAQTVMIVAWVFFPLDSGMTAPQAAGVIHSDFEKGFIRAETVSILIRFFGFLY